MRLATVASSPWWHRDFIALLDTTLPQGDDAIPVDRAAILLSAHRSTLVRSELDVEHGLRRLDALAARCSQPTIDAWHRVLFVDEGLSGNGIDYHDLRNSFVVEVLERRVGIPISLSVVGIAVARRIGLNVYGIGMPGHYLLGHGTDANATYIDPFHGGTVLDVDQATNRFREMFGPNQSFDSNFLAPTSTEATLVRMLANLKQNYARLRDVPGLLDVMRLRSALPDTSITEGRELVRLLHVTGNSHDALAICDQIEAHHPSARGLIDAERDRITAGFN